VQCGDVGGQGDTLAELGNLYDDLLGRPEDALAFYRQAVEKFIEIGNIASEGMARSNLCETLRRLRRLTEARQEILRAIECKEQFGHASAPWTTWSILAAIETDTGDLAAAAHAKRNAIARYLAYRRDGGENQFPSGRLGQAVTESLLTEDPVTTASLLQELAANPIATGLTPFIGALQAVVAGSRDRSLADAPDLDYDMAAELVLLIETLEERA
jgi:tetratricopeptide (TPR) repeat protein